MLVVEDEVHILRIIEYKLCSAGYRVIAAQDGLDGVEKAKAERPDLILLDVMMPRMDGFQALQILKEDPVTRDIPVFMLTVKGSEVDHLRGFDLGVREYITKPFSPAQLLERVDVLLGRGQESK